MAESKKPNPKPKGRPALHGAAEFISWTWEMVNGGFADVTWSTDGSEVVVSNPERMAKEVLPQFFRNPQYSSWVRSLNAYQFKKTRPGQWTNPNFRRDHPELLKNINRKTAKPSVPKDASDAHVESEHNPEQKTTWELLVEEQERLKWMKEEMASLERQVREAQDEEFKLRYDAVRLGSFVASELRAFAPAPLDPHLASLGSAVINNTPDCPKALLDTMNYEPSPGECPFTDKVRQECGGCHCTAVQVRRLCLEHKAACHEHDKLCLDMCTDEGKQAAAVAQQAAAVVDEALLQGELSENLSKIELDELARDVQLDLDRLDAELDKRERGQPNEYGQVLAGEAHEAPATPPP